LQAILGLSQDGACTNLCENFREISLKREISNDTTVNLPLFSLVNTFKETFHADEITPSEQEGSIRFTG
jgi:hypothetical protein